MRNTDFTDTSEMAVVRLPRELRERALEKAKAEDLSFSQLMRRSLRRELGEPITNTAATIADAQVGTC